MHHYLTSLCFSFLPFLLGFLRHLHPYCLLLFLLYILINPLFYFPLPLLISLCSPQSFFPSSISPSLLTVFTWKLNTGSLGMLWLTTSSTSTGKLTTVSFC